MEIVIRIVNGTEIILAQDKVFSMTMEKNNGSGLRGRMGLKCS